MLDFGSLSLCPTPKTVTRVPGVFSFGTKCCVTLESPDPQLLLPAVEKAGLDWEVTTTGGLPENRAGLVLRLDDKSDIASEGYTLDITHQQMRIVARDPAGAFYGACTLAQIIRQCSPVIPCLSISDWPDFPARGVMLDISRDKVPTMQTLYHLIDLLSEWKVNQFQLYTEHTFAYPSHRVVWEQASPMTGEEIVALDDYCKSRFVELVPNQNSFGHMERWLKHEDYRHLAECPDGYKDELGRPEMPSTLCPTDTRCLEFVGDLYDEVLPHFSSRLLNVGGDEPWELGQGRSAQECKLRGVGPVYLDFMRQIHKLAEDRGRTMMFWGDVVSLYPEVIPDIPKNVIALEWGYESGHPFDTRCANYADAGIPYYVCPSTSNAVSFTGRADNAIENIAAAARSGVKHGAIGLLNTEWGDGGHWHPLSVAYLGLMAGASASWNATADVQDGLLRNLSLHAFRDSTGKVARAFCDLGNIYLIFKGRHLNTSVPGHLLLLPDMLEHSDKATVSEYEELEARLDHIARQVSGDAMEAPDASIIRSEIDQVIGILRFSARVGKAELGSPDGTDLQKELESARCIQERVWLLRNRPGGLADSLSKLRWAQEPLLAYR